MSVCALARRSFRAFPSLSTFAHTLFPGTQRLSGLLPACVGRLALARPAFFPCLAPLRCTGTCRRSIGATLGCPGFGPGGMALAEILEALVTLQFAPGSEAICHVLADVAGVLDRRSFVRRVAPVEKRRDARMGPGRHARAR